MNRRHALVYASFMPLAHGNIARAAPDLGAKPEVLPLRNLLVEVRQVQSDESRVTGVGLDSAGRLTGQAGQTQGSASAVQQTLVLNGRTARIALQTSTPLRLYQTVVRGGQVLVIQGSVLLEAGTGFSATPRWDGGSDVELELAAQQALQHANTPPGAQANATTSSVVRLPLNTWSTVGESDQNSQGDQSGLTGVQNTSGRRRTEVQVRISVR
jgi:hypothetical protein